MRDPDPRLWAVRLRVRDGRGRVPTEVLTRDRVRAFGARPGSALFAATLVSLLLGWAPAAIGQVAAVVAVTSDYRYHGVAISDARPAISLDLAYDSPGGAYAGGSLVGSDAPGAGPRVLGAMADVGYARRAGAGFTLDAGFDHATFFRYGYGAGSAETTEAYVGVARGPLQAYVYYSPHYFAPSVKTIYLSFDGAVRPVRRLRLFGHVGALDTLSAPTGADAEARYDARVGIAREFRGGEVQLAWTVRSATGAGPSTRRDALILGASWFF